MPKTLHCPCTGINIPRFLGCVIAGYAFLFGFDYVVHHILLMDIYTQTMDLWRPEEEMSFPLMIAYNVLLVAILGFIFTRNYEEKGIGEGLRFGVSMGALLALMNAASYIWMPIPLELALGWGGAGLGAAIGIGIIFSLIYKK